MAYCLVSLCNVGGFVLPVHSETYTLQKAGLAHILFEKRWDPFVIAIIIGTIAIFAWIFSVPTGREFGLGILIGSFIAAKGANEFRVRVPDSKTVVYSATGGVLIGIGATLAGGCSIGNGLVETSFFSWQGWVSLSMMILGTRVAAYFTIIKPRANA
ncbi:inner membrane protein [Actinobacillus ureae]|nr:inner membrane protein [Actinobacillus ureae]SUU43451.1 inner membrane protein [Actinobacillus ureae]